MGKLLRRRTRAAAPPPDEYGAVLREQRPLLTELSNRDLGIELGRLKGAVGWAGCSASATSSIDHDHIC